MMKLRLKYFGRLFFKFLKLNNKKFSIPEAIKNNDWNEKNIENINDKTNVFWVK